MLKSTILPTVAFVFLIVFGIGTVSADIANKPTHKPGEWWELSIKTKNILSGWFYGLDGEYRIEVVQDGFKCLYKEAGKWTDNCGEAREPVLETIIGVGDHKYLEFPISVGKRWKFSFRRHSGEAVITQAETIRAAGKTLRAYRIEREGSGYHLTESTLYWYAPDCKCISKFKHETTGHTWGSDLVEIHLTKFELK